MNYLKNIQITSIKAPLIIICLVYLAHIVSDFIWLVFTPEHNKQQISQTITQNNSQYVLPVNIFGKEKKVVKQVYKQVKNTKLNLFLVGIINKKEGPIAIIQFVSGGVDKVYKIGDNINANAVLKDIGDNFVIIDNNGREEKLTIKFKVNKTLEGVKTQEDNVNEVDIVKSANDINDGYKKNAAKLESKTKRKLRVYLADMRTNPASALAVVAVEPNFTAGLLSGFKVFPAKERELFFKIGFKTGDIITKINDIELNNFAKAFKIGKELATQKTFDFVVLRGGIERYIYLDLN